MTRNADPPFVSAKARAVAGKAGLFEVGVTDLQEKKK